MKRWLVILYVVLAFFFTFYGIGYAQTYQFQVDAITVDVYWNEDGSSSIDYVFVFTNGAFASPIDYVDVGIPNSNFDVSSISADVDGKMITDISRSGFQGTGSSGVALGLGSNAIQPGKTGRVHVFIGVIRDVLYPDDDDTNYVSAVFIPTYFSQSFVLGTTNLDVGFHLPPGIAPEEPRWHSSPSGFPSQPETSLDSDGRVLYVWKNPKANAYTQYKFGASFPLQYVPEKTVVRPSFWEILGIDSGDLMGFTFCCGFFVFMGFITFVSARGNRKRKLQYLSPKIAIEGHGIKRGLTAVEAAILLEQPLDKILTMILFATIKKGAATVTQRDPLKLEIPDQLPEDLREYEVNFLLAFREKNEKDRRKNLQSMVIDLVNTVSKKMKGFSRRETVAYYREIIKRAWAQVEAADTPEVKSQRFDEVMEWTMLDKDYDDRTGEIFRTGPVFVPVWWPRFDPGYGRSVTPRPSPAPISTSGPMPGKGVSLPTLPGSAFAASIVNGVQNFSSNVIGNVTDFTSGVTNRTNPIPVSTSRGISRSSGGGCACACACACAGCACACAGGGR